MYSDKHRAADCLQDILDNIALIEKFIAGHDQYEIDADELRHAALERWLERICEAAFRLGQRSSALMPDHPWQRIRGFGNRLRHAYDQIDFDIVWAILTDELPRLKIDAAEALERVQAEDPA